MKRLEIAENRRDNQYTHRHLYLDLYIHLLHQQEVVGLLVMEQVEYGDYKMNTIKEI
jgi:hypothetical protein